MHPRGLSHALSTRHCGSLGADAAVVQRRIACGWQWGHVGVGGLGAGVDDTRAGEAAPTLNLRCWNPICACDSRRKCESGGRWVDFGGNGLGGDGMGLRLPSRTLMGAAALGSILGLSLRPFEGARWRRL